MAAQRLSNIVSQLSPAKSTGLATVYAYPIGCE